MNTYGESKRPLWHWVLIYALIGGLIYGVVYYFFYANKNRYQAPWSKNRCCLNLRKARSSLKLRAPRRQLENIVTLTATGFAPSPLTIQAGETVAWVNGSGRLATVDSAPHPAHTDYPLLNLGEFADGETLTLTFPDPGTYYYHNHLDATQFGSIIVQ